MPWPKTGTTLYNALLELRDKGRAIKRFVVCYVVWLGPMIYGMGVWSNARCVGVFPCCGQSGWLLSSSTATPPDTYRYISHTYIIKN